MIALQIIWLATIALTASMTAYLIVCNEFNWARRCLSRLGSDAGVMLFLSIGLHASVAVALAASASAGTAIILMSLVGFVWASLSYFLFQRFATPLEQPGVARRAPTVLPSISFGCFVSSVLSLVVFLRWYWAIVPVLIWLLIGIAAAEYMIRRAMARGCERGLAILGINSAQGTRGYFDMDRYPFP